MVSLRLLGAVAAGVLAAGAAVAPVRAAPVAEEPTGRVCLEDVKYLVRAHRGNLAELAAGAAVLPRSKDRRVHHLAGMLIVDHTRAEVRVVAAARRHDVTLPPKPTRQQRADLAAVTALAGPEFDLAWLKLQEKAHEQTLDFIDREVADGCAADVRALAAATEKTVEAHLEATRDALAAIGD
jgi:putative membrane protein